MGTHKDTMQDIVCPVCKRYTLYVRDVFDNISVAHCTSPYCKTSVYITPEGDVEGWSTNGFVVTNGYRMAQATHYALAACDASEGPIPVSVVRVWLKTILDAMEE